MKLKTKIKIKLVFFRTLYSQSAASLTMGYIASVLRKEGHNIDLCLLEKNNPLNIKLFWDSGDDFDIIIAKPNFKDFTYLLSFLEKVKKRKKSKKIFLCGPFASLHWKSIIINQKWLDGIIIGEPEKTVLNLVDSFLEKSLNLQILPGLVLRNFKNGKIIKSNAPPIAPSLDKIPFPARDIEKIEKGNYINIEASRGCSFNCSFCHVPIFTKLCDSPARRVRNPKLVVREIETLTRKLNKSFFIFNDSHFWNGPKDDERILEFCDEIKKRKLDIRMYAYFRCNPFPTKKIIKALADAGLVRMFVGLENASKNSQKIYNKVIDLNHYKKIKNTLDKYNINIHLGYLVFHPYASLTEIEINLKYLYKIKKLFRLGVILEQVRVLPGSVFQKKLTKDGLFNKKGYNNYTYGARFLNQEVETLFNDFKKMFNEQLENTSYDFEYYCTSGELLKNIAIKINNDFKKMFKKEYNDFYFYREKGMNLLNNYFRRSIKLVKLGANKKDVSDIQKNKNFMKKFKDITMELQISWGAIIEKVKNNGGSRAVEELYRGIESI